MVLKDEEKVIPVDPRDMPPNSDDGKKKMLMRLLTVVVIPAAICFIMIQYAFPSIDKKTFDLNFTNVATDISSLQAKSADYESANTTIKTQFATMNNDFKTLNSKVDAINLSAYAKASEVTEIRNGLNTLANSIANVANNSTITDIKSQVKSVSDSNTLQEVKIQANTDKNTSQDTRLATLEEQVKKLQATPTTTPTTTPTSTTTINNKNVWDLIKFDQLLVTMRPYSSRTDMDDGLEFEVTNGVSNKQKFYIDIINNSTTYQAEDIVIEFSLEWYGTNWDSISYYDWDNISITSKTGQIRATWEIDEDGEYSFVTNGYSRRMVLEPSETKSILVTIEYNASEYPTLNGYFYLYPQLEGIDYTPN